MSKRCGNTARQSGRTPGPSPGRPIEPLFEPIVAPKDLAVLGDETGRADDANLGGAAICQGFALIG